MTEPRRFSIPDISQLDAGADATNPSNPAYPPERALSGVHDMLMGLPGVVMVGQGMDEIGNPALIVGVKSRADLARIPSEAAGLPIVAQVIGEVDALPR